MPIKMYMLMYNIFAYFASHLHYVMYSRVGLVITQYSSVSNIAGHLIFIDIVEYPPITKNAIAF